MRTFILCCNYNEEKTGSLSACLDSVRQAKLPDTFFAVADNGSRDNSALLLKKYRSDGTINLLLLSDRNLGKPHALNLLWREICKRYPFSPDDLVMSLDSDITLGGNGEFFRHTQSIFSTFADQFCAMSVMLTENNCHRVNFAATPVTEFSGDRIFCHGFSNGVGGAVVIATVKAWQAVGGYRENCGKNGTSAIYGADDCMLFQDFFNYSGGKPIIISEKLASRHPANADQAYQTWKNEVNRIMNFGLGNSMLPDKGFYD